ncbi:hypothetical protein [Streptomyces sp. S.PNR 29]|nr:hypothetical protein [Streptomyces sp. S.PNR 29]MDN0198823.1 hypothetical protein [Streptomyces sp. S.PNR 29]
MKAPHVRNLSVTQTAQIPPPAQEDAPKGTGLSGHTARDFREVA